MHIARRRAAGAAASPSSPTSAARRRPGAGSRRSAESTGLEPVPAEGTFGVLLLVTRQESLRDDIALIAAVVGARLECREDWQGADPEDWAAMMCGTDVLPPSARIASQTLLLGGAELWEAAAQHAELTPVALPEGEVWLSEHLRACVLDRMPGQVLVVAGAFGGAGATTFSYLAAAEGAVRGHMVMLVDADAQAGAGVHSLVEEARAEGSLEGPGSRALSWEALQEVDGEISAAQLSAVLPLLDGVRVVTHGGDGAVPGPSPEAVEAVVRAGRRVFDLVVVDVSRQIGTLSVLAGHTDLGLIVTQASRRGTDAAEQVRRGAGDAPLALAVNGDACRGWDLRETAEAVGLPVAAECAEQRWLRTADGLGEAYEMLRSRRGAALAARLLEAVGLDD